MLTNKLDKLLCCIVVRLAPVHSERSLAVEAFDFDIAGNYSRAIGESHDAQQVNTPAHLAGVVPL